MKIKYYISKCIKKIVGVPSINSCNVHKTAKIGEYSAITKCNIGKYSYIGDNSNVTYANIGNFTSISSYCAIGGGAHPIDWVSTSPVFTSHRSILRFNFAKHEFNPYKIVEIGNDVWIGAHCMIKSGVKIADGAIIGMGSVVTKDVGPYEIWAGNPAKLIRKRFDDEIISALLETQWWNCNDDELYKIADKFNNVDEFIKTERNKANEEA